MTLRRVVLGGLLGATLALVGIGGEGSSVGAADLHHAAVVIDTGDGNVRRFCLAFPEETITGAEALRRVESEVVFAGYGGKGQGVCALCGVGCPAGDCFCDRSKYWAYHRAGPGGAPYTYSRAGVSSTTVGDGDVEGWRWGTGAAPPAATVGEVCDVPEPPVRTASGTPATTTSTSTVAAAEPPPETASTSPTAAPPVPTARQPAAAGTTVPPTPGPAAPTSTAVPAEETTATAAPAVDPAPDGPEADQPTDEEERAAAPIRAPGGGEGGAPVDPIGAAAFVALLGAVLGWRARLRRANVRRVTPLR